MYNDNKGDSDSSEMLSGIFKDVGLVANFRNKALVVRITVNSYYSFSV